MTLARKLRRGELVEKIIRRCRESRFKEPLKRIASDLGISVDWVRKIKRKVFG